MGHHPINQNDAIQATYIIRDKQPPVSVEVLLDQVQDDLLFIRTDEHSRRFTIPRRGVRISKIRDGYATLSLSERKAIDYNLV